MTFGKHSIFASGHQSPFIDISWHVYCDGLASVYILYTPVDICSHATSSPIGILLTFCSHDTSPLPRHLVSLIRTCSHHIRTHTHIHINSHDISQKCTNQFTNFPLVNVILRKPYRPLTVPSPLFHILQVPVNQRFG